METGNIPNIEIKVIKTLDSGKKAEIGWHQAIYNEMVEQSKMLHSIRGSLLFYNFLIVAALALMVFNFIFSF